MLRALKRVSCRPSAPLLLITAMALLLRLAGVWFGWPYIFHPDEPRIIARSMHMLQPLFMGDFASLDLNPHFFTYPSLYLYFLAAIFGILGLLLAPLHAVGLAPDLLDWYQLQPASFHIIARFINAALGTATVPLLYWLGARTWSKPVGLAAAAFLAVNPLHMEESHFATTDVPATLVAVAAFCAAVALHRSGALRYYFLGGLLSGLAMGIKYPAGLIFLSIVAAALLRLVVPPAQRAAEQAPAFPARPAPVPISPLVGLLIGAFALVDAFLISTPFAVLDPRSVLNDLVTEWIATRSGFLGASSGNFFFYIAPPDPRIGLGLFGLVGLAAGIVLWGRKSIPLLLMLLAAAMPGFLLVSTSVIKIDRYVLPSVPFLALLAAPTLVAAWERLAPLSRQVPLAAAATSIVLMAQPAVKSAGCVVSQFLPDPRFEMARWAEANIPPGAPILATEYGSFPIVLAGTGVPVQLIPEPYDDRVRERIRWEAQTLQRPLAGPVLALVLARRIHTPAMAARVLAILPAINDTLPPALPRGQASYIAITDFLVELYQDPDTQRFYPRTAVAWNAFLQRMDSQASLVGEQRSPSQWCTSFLRAPAIRLYQAQ